MIRLDFLRTLALAVFGSRINPEPEPVIEPETVLHPVDFRRQFYPEQYTYGADWDQVDVDQKAALERARELVKYHLDAAAYRP